MASDLALPAFLSSAHGAQHGVKKLLPDISENEYTDLVDANQMWENRLNNNASHPKTLSLQAEWDKPIYKAKYDQLLGDQTCPAEKARLSAVAAEHSSDWLNALPTPALGLKLDNISLRIACGLRLGATLCQPYKCT